MDDRTDCGLRNVTAVLYVHKNIPVKTMSTSLNDAAIFTLFHHKYASNIAIYFHLNFRVIQHITVLQLMCVCVLSFMFLIFQKQ